MKNTMLFLPALLSALTACGQGKPSAVAPAAPEAAPAGRLAVGGPCEGCEAVFEMTREPGWTDTLASPDEPGERMVVSGTVYRRDGRTPAPGVILYVYHTNAGGVYPTRGGEKGWARRHGYLRGWMRTDGQGRYQFVSIRPGSYPNSRNPAHVHATVLEDDKTPYYLDDYLFDDDPLLTQQERSRLRQRGGNGILILTRDADGAWEGRRDIILGLNIPNYPGG
jgi:protocatechuate 3,4-dioxygenase beta subunit